jgi:hypothetical protein
MAATMAAMQGQQESVAQSTPSPWALAMFSSDMQELSKAAVVFVVWLEQCRGGRLSGVGEVAGAMTVVGPVGTEGMLCAEGRPCACLVM